MPKADISSEVVTKMISALLLSNAYISYVKENDEILHKEANGTPPIDNEVTEALEALCKEASADCMKTYGMPLSTVLNSIIKQVNGKLN